MMKYLQRLGKSLMLPVAALPVAALLMGIGYWIDPAGWGEKNLLAALLLKAGGALIGNMSILFAVGVAIGMSDDREGTAGLAGLISFLVFTTVLSVDSVGTYYKALGIDGEVPAAFAKISNQFIGILAGLVGATCYNRFKNTKLPDFLAFFSGRRSVAMTTAVSSLIICVPLFYLWPLIFGGLVSLGKFITGLGALGAGIYAFFNRLLIPVGLHHALNSVFWFDIANISDINRFWKPEVGIIADQIGLFANTPVTGSYMTGFFPVMMFGLPGAAFAMYRQAKPAKRAVVMGLMFSAALSSFFVGVTEPLEFAFMFLAPVLYLVHAVLTGIFVAVAALLPVRAGFNFSAGFVDWFLSFKAPGAINVWLVIALGLVAFVVYFLVFTVLIKVLNLKTPGREDEDEETVVAGRTLKGDEKYQYMASEIYEALGGKENIQDIDNCITRLRLELVDSNKVDETRIKKLGVAGVLKPSSTSMQVIVGPDVQFVADALRAKNK